MKVVLFCGGRACGCGISERLPKPMVPIGERPMLWHVMKYYATTAQGLHAVPRLRRPQIKEYFLDYKEWVSNDFTLEPTSGSVVLQAPTWTTGASRSSTPVPTR